jgi:hypothetical protein
MERDNGIHNVTGNPVAMGLYCWVSSWNPHFDGNSQVTGTIITVKKDGTTNFQTILCDEGQVQIILPLETNMAMKWAMSWLGKTFLRQIVPTFFRKN